MGLRQLVIGGGLGAQKEDGSAVSDLVVIMEQRERDFRCSPRRLGKATVSRCADCDGGGA